MKYTERDFKQWVAYEEVRKTGKYNMIMDFFEASKEAGLSITIYTKIQKHYSFIKKAIEEKYGSVEIYLNKQKDKK